MRSHRRRRSSIGERARAGARATVRALGIVTLLLSVPAWGDHPTAHAERLVEQWRIAEAVHEAAPLLQSRRDDPEVIALDANLRFLEGDYGGAAARYQEAIDRVEGQAGRNRLLQGPSARLGISVDEWRAGRELAVATAETTRGFVEERSPGGHFVIRHAPGRDALLVPYAAEALEAAYKEIGEHDFGDAPTEPVRVEIFPEVADLAKVSTLTLKEIETSGTIALCKFNRLMIVSPRALARGYPWLDTLAHEYTHFVVSRSSYNTVPIWFHEGLAKFEERRWRVADDAGLTPTMEHLLATALGKGRRLITFDEMYPSMAKLPSQADTALAFAEVFSVVEYLHERQGWQGVRAVVARMRDGKGDAGAVAEVLGEGFEEFVRGWKAWLKVKKLRTHPGLVPSSLKFVKARGDGAKKEDEDDSQEITEKRAQGFARLGGMLRKAGRLGPATVEYGKAEALVGAGHPAVANKLARTWLELGDPDKAIAAAEPSAALNPDLAAPVALLGEAYLKKGNRDKAAGYFEAAIRINPFDPSPHCGLGEIWAGKGDPRATREVAACRELSAP